MVNTAVARASDDFYPRDPHSTTPHIAASAFNSIFLAPLVHPDWDMFQSKHPGARLHAMARAVSGAAIYVSDKPGVHDFELLKELVLPNGGVLRAQLPGRPTRDCLFRNVLKDSKTLLKVVSVGAIDFQSIQTEGFGGQREGLMMPRVYLIILFILIPLWAMLHNIQVQFLWNICS